ncbi:hypothetical protein [Streptomyces sp. ST1015]|uniref:hypothetical protein n=1 Tax=Streptomyces sp. ST1015 TaxID=1848900 RepID=UPI000DD91CC8|nr:MULTISPECIES: hypothetical protein [unclassified Streptomyces]QZZ26499.1 hypothetical protein A7X85_09755 [Streptomyces sp. ST1015]
MKAGEPSVKESGPLHLSVWSPEVRPVPGCAECAELAKLWAQARRAGDRSLASDHAVRIRTHDTGHAGTP